MKQSTPRTVARLLAVFAVAVVGTTEAQINNGYMAAAAGGLASRQLDSLKQFEVQRSMQTYTSQTGLNTSLNSLKARPREYSQIVAAPSANEYARRAVEEYREAGRTATEIVAAPISPVATRRAVSEASQDAEWASWDMWEHIRRAREYQREARSASGDGYWSAPRTKVETYFEYVKVLKAVGFNKDGQPVLEMRDDVQMKTRVVPSK